MMINTPKIKKFCKNNNQNIVNNKKKKKTFKMIKS